MKKELFKDIGGVYNNRCIVDNKHHSFFFFPLASSLSIFTILLSFVETAFNHRLNRSHQYSRPYAFLRLSNSVPESSGFNKRRREPHRIKTFKDYGNSVAAAFLKYKNS